MNSMPIWSMDGAADGEDMPFSVFGRWGETPLFDFDDDVALSEIAPSRPEPKPFQRLFGTLSLADLNEYRLAAGREPDLDARAFYVLHEAADRFFPIRSDETGGRYLRNAYLKYMSEQAGLAEIAASLEAAAFTPSFKAASAH